MAGRQVIATKNLKTIKSDLFLSKNTQGWVLMYSI
jgi:hypothetical protein